MKESEYLAWVWRYVVLGLLIVILVNTSEAAEVSVSAGSLMDENPDWKVVSARINGPSPFTWYARFNLYGSDRHSLCAGGMYTRGRWFGGGGICDGTVDDKYVGTRNRYNLFGGVYVGKKRRWFITLDHESNCRTFWNETGDRCLYVLPRGDDDKANKGLNFLKGGFRFKTGGK